MTSTLHLYAGFIRAERVNRLETDRVFVAVSGIITTDETLAITTAVLSAEKRWPVEDGWREHQAQLVMVSDKFINQAALMSNA